MKRLIISILPYFFTLCVIIFFILAIVFFNNANKIRTGDGVQSEQEKHFRKLAGIFTLLWFFFLFPTAIAFGVANDQKNRREY